MLAESLCFINNIGYFYSGKVIISPKKKKNRRLKRGSKRRRGRKEKRIKKKKSGPKISYPVNSFNNKYQFETFSVSSHFLRVLWKIGKKKN